MSNSTHMNEQTQKQTRAMLRQQVRALKSQGFSYADAGRIIQQDGKPIGTAMAKYYAARQENECRGCIRPLAKGPK